MLLGGRPFGSHGAPVSQISCWSLPCAYRISLLTWHRFAYPAYGTIDRWGRRALVLTTLPFLALTLVAAALCFQISNADARLPAVATFLILYMIFYSVGAGPVPFTYSAEVFPLVNRGSTTTYHNSRCMKLTLYLRSRDEFRGLHQPVWGWLAVAVRSIPQYQPDCDRAPISVCVSRTLVAPIPC